MTTANNVFIGTVVFYTVFITLMGLIPQSDINITDAGDQEPPFQDIPLLGDLFEFFNNAFVNITGFPSIIQTLIFTPMAGFLVYWFVRFIGWLLPFVGGS